MNPEAICSPTKGLQPIVHSSPIKIIHHTKVTDNDLVDAIEAEGTIEPDNQMHTVFEWDDPVSKMKKVTVVLTLPSGVKNIKVLVGGAGGSGVTSEVIVKYPWNHSFMDPNVILKNKDNKNDSIFMGPEAVAFTKAINLHRENVEDLPEVTFKILLPIPVQTMPNSYTTSMKTFTPRNNDSSSASATVDQKQKVLIVRLTGVVEKFHQKFDDVIEEFDSEDEDDSVEESTESSESDTGVRGRGKASTSYRKGSKGGRAGKRKRG